MTSILVIRGRVSCNQFKCNYLRNKSVFDKFSLRLWILLNLKIFLKKKKKKKKSDSLRIFEIIEFEVRGYLNDKKVLFQNTLRSSLRSRFSETA